ncbi:hypothetical protein EDB84DRAFT_1441753, partial [Lactarius hengduanensis]
LFNNEAQSTDTYESTCNCILTSIAEITKSQDASVAAPRQSAEAANKKQMPLSFLVYNLTSDQADLILQHHVWSSRAITFRATCFGHSCPNFMFTISGLGTISVKAVHLIVKQVWESESTRAFIQSLADQVPVEEIEQTRAELTHMLKLLSITRLDTKEAGNVLKPCFNISYDISCPTPYQWNAGAQPTNPTSYAQIVMASTTRGGYAPSWDWQDGTVQQKTLESCPPGGTEAHPEWQTGTNPPD